MILRLLPGLSVLMLLLSLSVYSQDIQFHSDYVEFTQGEIIAGMLSVVTKDYPYTIRLEKEDGSIAASTESFSVDGFQFFVLPLRFDLPPGEYRVRAVPRQSANPQLKSVAITIAAEDYPYQEIHLTREVSNLRRTEDPRRVEESEHLWSVISNVDSDAVYHRGSMQMPLVAYSVSSEFAHQRVFLYDDGASSRSIHYGWDLAAPQGTDLFAPGAGRVVLARNRMITGNSIIIEHLPGMYSLLYHLETIRVQEGDVVEIGDYIGTVGSTGVSTGPHLHWEIRIRTVPVHPQALLNIDMLDTEAYMPHIGDE